MTKRVMLALAASLMSRAGLLAQGALAGTFQQHTVHIYPGRDTCPFAATTAARSQGPSPVTW